MSFFYNHNKERSRGVPLEVDRDSSGKSTARKKRSELLSTDLDPDGGVAQAFIQYNAMISAGAGIASKGENLFIPPGDLSKRLEFDPPVEMRNQFWEEAVKEYKQHKENQAEDPVQAFEWQLFSDQLQRIGVARKDILDLGTGTLLLPRQLSSEARHLELRDYRRIYATDVSRGMLKESQNYFGPELSILDPNRVVLLQALMSDQILARESVHLVTALNSLDGIPDEEVTSALGASFASLKNHGHMAILVRHPKRNEYYRTQGRVRNKEIEPEDEGPYLERWPGVPGVVAYYRSKETWGRLLSEKFYYYNENKDAVAGSFEVVTTLSTKLTRDEADRYPLLKERYFDPVTEERRSAGLVIILEKIIDDKYRSVR